jgi:hypothetical protein
VPEAKAVVGFALAGLLMLWATAIHLRARPPSVLRRVLESLLGTAQALALLYCAIELNGLWLKLVVTVMQGGRE